MLDISAGYALDASVWVTGGSDGSKDLKTTEIPPLGKHILLSTCRENLIPYKQ